MLWNEKYCKLCVCVCVCVCVYNQQQEDHVLTAWKHMAFVVWSENVGDVKINICLSTQWKE